MNKQSQTSTARLAGIVLLAAFALAANAAEIIKPQIGEPLRDAAVTCDPEGTYYLTGTRAIIKDGKPDFMDNDGIKVWSSKDLKSWKDEGLAWDMQSKEYLHDRMNRRLFAMPDRPFGKELRVQGATGPRLFQAGENWYMTYSICGHDARILRSDKGPSGPYQVHWEPSVKEKSNRAKDAPFFNRGPGRGSLFRDADGSLYLIRGPGFIQKFNQELNQPEGLAGSLLAGVKGYPSDEWCARQFDPHGAAVFLNNGVYYLTWAAYTDEAGYKRNDTFVAVADALMGPYGEPSLLIPGGGPAVLFAGTDSRLMASCSIADAPVLVPLKAQGATLVADAMVMPTDPVKAPRAGKIVMYDYAHSQPSGKWFETNPRTERTRLTPLFDLPLADTAICKGRDAWYMTGTVASKRTDGKPDFQNNDGIYLWKSTDLATWIPMGKVWDIEKDGAAWNKDYRIPGDNPVRDDFCRGVTAPEIHYVADTFWIPYSMNGRGTGLLKSQSGKAEGPYSDLGRITGLGEAPNLFIDDLPAPAGADGQAGGTAYWLWGRPLSLAPLDLETARLAGAPVPLEARFGFLPPGMKYDSVDIWEPTGPFMFKVTNPKNGAAHYCLSFSAITQDYGRANRETLITRFDSLDGLSLFPLLMARHGGQNSAFKGPDGEWYASFSGADPSAVFRERPGIYPLVMWNQMGYNVPRKPWHGYYTRAGGRDDWDPMLPDNYRDLFITNTMPDGYHYYLCSPPSGDKAVLWRKEGVQVFRSKDLKNWERLPCPYTYERAKKEYRAYKEARNEPINPNAEKWFSPDGEWIGWSQMMVHMKGNYWIIVGAGSINNGDCFLLKSETGKAEGPYTLHGVIPAAPPAEFCVEDDGRVYAGWGFFNFNRFTEDLTGEDKSWKGFRESGRDNYRINTGRVNANNDCGFGFKRIDGKYVYVPIQSAGSYSASLFYSDTFGGEYKPFIGYLPDQGYGCIFHDANGQWYSAMQGMHDESNYGKPCVGNPIQPIHLDMKSDPPRVFLQYELDRIGQAVYEK